MDRFVCVRMIQANAMDLTRFQFDYDMSFAVTFLNADGTVYGRYGSRSATGDEADRDISLAGLKSTLEAVLALHEDYPSNRELLSGKQPRPVARTRPEQFPGLGRYPPAVDFAGQPVASCLHCHQIQEAMRLEWRERGETAPEKVLYPWPMPETVGFSMDPATLATVDAVEKGTAAEKAGLRPGDSIAEAGGQAVVSTADLQWVLHHAGEAENVGLTIQRDETSLNLGLELEKGWRKQSDIAWRVSTWDLRRMVLGGMFLETVGREERSKLGIEQGRMALRARHVGEFGEHAVAKSAGLRKGDIIVGFDGSEADLNESALIARILQEHQAGGEVEVVALREGERLEVRLKVQ